MDEQRIRKNIRQRLDRAGEVTEDLGLPTEDKYDLLDVLSGPPAEWREVHLPGPGLGKVSWKHVHSDGSEHDTNFTPPKGAWGGLVGEIPTGGRIECLDCGTIVEGG